MTVAPYRAPLESDVVLRNGRTLRLRAIRHEDREALISFYAGLSTDSLHARFFDLCRPERALEYSPVDVDQDHDLGIVAELGDEIVGVAHYFGSKRKPGVAEVAFAIADEFQSCGVATKLLEKLAEAARTRGIERFEAEVLTENSRMLDVFRMSGFDVDTRSGSDTVRVTFSIAQTVAFDDAAALRS